MPARAARATRAPAAPPIVAEAATPPFDESTLPPAPEPAPEPPATAGARAPTPQPTGYKGLKVWQRAMDLATAVHQTARTLPPGERDALGADLRRTAAQVPAYIAAGNSLFQRAEYVQYLSAAHGAVARVETLLLFAERLGHLPPGEIAPLLSLAGQTGYLLRALTRALQPPPHDGSPPSPRSAGRRPAPVAGAE